MRRRKAAEEQKKDEVSSAFQMKTHCSVVNNQTGFIAGKKAK